MTLPADAERRAVLFVTEGRDAETIKRLTEDLRVRGADPEAIESVSIDMSPAFIKGVGELHPANHIDHGQGDNDSWTSMRRAHE